MTRSIIAAALAAFIALPAVASDGEYDMIDDTLKAQITTLLSEQGYEVRSIETEDELIEVDVLKEGEPFEVYLDAELNIVRTQADD